jgi:hypothetical protein
MTLDPFANPPADPSLALPPFQPLASPNGGAPALPSAAPIPPAAPPATAAAKPARTVSGPPPLRFGLCGAAGGGKTTYLSALNIAVTDADQRLGDWGMAPWDDSSKDFVVEGAAKLVTERVFPPATRAEGQLKWTISGPPARQPKRAFWRRKGSNELNFLLEVDDVPGDAFLGNAQAPLSADAMDRIIDADGLIFLIDPMRELNRAVTARSNWVYFHNLIETIKMRLAQRGELRRGRLPHHVAMCMTKFDEQVIFQRAYHERYIDIGDDGQPHVPPERAGDFFEWVCDWIDRDRGDASAAQLRQLVQGSFAPQRVRYYATSSIGFYIPRGAGFNLHDYANVEFRNGQPHIRGSIRPVNVLEPLVDLEQRIRAEGRR